MAYLLVITIYSYNSSQFQHQYIYIYVTNYWFYNLKKHGYLIGYSYRGYRGYITSMVTGYHGYHEIASSITIPNGEIWGIIISLQLLLNESPSIPIIYIYTYVYIYINKKHGISIGGSPIYSYHLIPTPQMAPRPSAPWCWRAATAVCTCWAPTSCWSWAGAATNHGTEPTWAYIVIYGD